MKGDYGDVKFGQYSLDGWFSVFFERDIFDDTVGLANAHMQIIWRSLKLSFMTTILTLIFAFPPPISSRRGRRRRARSGSS